MCGIAGFRSFAGRDESLAGELAAALQALRHRGPDDGGQWVDEAQQAGLGQRRLAIVDLSACGHQPMVSACGQWVMVFNGEVYNFRELRRELQALGHHFPGTGDSEVVLAAISQWGVAAALPRFLGMFAIALWHKPTRELHLVRDRLGVKPLYYHWDGRRLFFGSELKALREFEDWSPEIDRDALADYLRYGYIAEPRSIYRRVSKLPPAHRLVLDAQGGMQLHQYWDPLDAVGLRTQRDEQSLADELEALMADAFRYRLIADVPVGVFLSGGVDSSVLAALLQKHAGQTIKTYTIGFDVPEYDESPYAAEVARHLGTEHHERRLQVADARALLPSWGELFDEPFGDASGLPTLMVSRAAAEEVKVVLSADGGDELFSGYNSHATVLAQWDKVRGLPQGLRSLSAQTLRGIGVPALAETLAPGRGLLGSAVKRVAGIAERIDARSVGELFDTTVSRLAADEVQALTGRGPAPRLLADAYPGEPGEQLCLWDLQHYLPADVLTKVDRTTMACSIEGREPLLDHRLVEFALSLPFGLRRGALGGKHLLKKVLYRHVPRALVERPKRGFAVPVQQWLRGELAPLVDEHLEPRRITSQGLFDPEMVQGYVKRLRAGDAPAAQRVWLLLAFQMWHQRWMSA
ncbi:MAG: asparagine synthase (glutamine-hydrolyzing) [Pseudomonadota bacterium]